MTTRLLRSSSPSKYILFDDVSRSTLSSLLVVKFIDEFLQKVFLMGLWIDLVNAWASSFQGGEDYALPPPTKNVYSAMDGVPTLIVNEDKLPTIFEEGDEDDEDCDQLWS